MALFAAAVQSAIDELESKGCEIVEAAFEEDFTPHIVAEKDGHLLFVLVQAISGPHISGFSEQRFDSEIRPQIESITSHPKARSVANLASEHSGLAELAVVSMLETDDTHEDGEPIFLAKVFPLRAIGPDGSIAPAELDD